MNPIKLLLKIESGEVQPKRRGFFGALPPVFIYLLCIGIFGAITSAGTISDNPMPTLLMIIISILAIAAVIIVARQLFYEEEEVKVVKKKRVNLKVIILGFFLTIGLLLITYPLIYSIIMPLIGLEDTTNTPIELSNMSGFIIFTFIYGNIIAPLCEEILMRGVVLGGFLKRYSPAVSILLSALIFGVIHFNLNGFSAVIGGIVMGFAYYKFRSLILCFLIHFFNNIIAMYVPLLLVKIFPEFNLNFTITPTSIAIGLLFMGLGVLIILFIYKLLDKEFTSIDSRRIEIKN